MPKLTSTQAKAVEKVEPELGGGSFDPLPKGRYIGKLADVESKMSSNNNPMWAIEWDNIRSLDGEEKPGKQFFNLNFPTSAKRPAGWGDDKPNAKKSSDERWTEYQQRCKALIHGFFTAHGYTVDSDTDEMLGEDCILEIDVETQQKGARAGTLRNTVRGFLPMDGEATEAAAAAGTDDEDEF